MPRHVIEWLWSENLKGRSHLKDLGVDEIHLHQDMDAGRILSDGNEASV